MGKIRGTVTIDGKPLKKGKVEYIPIDGKTGTSGAVITDGTFFIERVPATKQRVQFSSRIVTSPPGTPDELITTALILPERYNSRSDIETDVKPGLNEPVYDLKSK